MKKQLEQLIKILSNCALIDWISQIIINISYSTPVPSFPHSVVSNLFFAILGLLICIPKNILIKAAIPATPTPIWLVEGLCFSLYISALYFVKNSSNNFNKLLIISTIIWFFINLLSSNAQLKKLRKNKISLEANYLTAITSIILIIREVAI
ncbi:hypothetical protein [Maridesulfovibrio sp.]|uniref:hypothetical protein n=1 Tax=Maridesulfovibrio sp. TaxID=2795000 RepID=UPI0029CA26CF|nr:hypothetical protein [Maridesulfovibrio sp.]